MKGYYTDRHYRFPNNDGSYTDRRFSATNLKKSYPIKLVFFKILGRQHKLKFAYLI